MIGPSGNVRVYLACGVTDMRRGIDGLSALVETVVKEAPGSGAIFGFRGKRADRIKILWWDGQGLCLFSKRLEKGRFVWPATAGTPTRPSRNGSRSVITAPHASSPEISMCIFGVSLERSSWSA